MNLRTSICGLAVAAALSLAAVSAASPFAASTGQYLLGGIDQYWYVSGPSISTPVLASALSTSGFPYSAYAANDAGSSWISPWADGGNSLSSSVTEGYYVYSTTVDFTGSTGVLFGHLFSDNAIVDINIGGTAVGGVITGGIDLGTTPLSTVYAPNSTGWFSTGTDFSITGSGVQTVLFRVRNGFDGFTGSPDPTGFRAHLGLVTTPEPVTMGLGVASVGLFLRRRKKRAS